MRDWKFSRVLVNFDEKLLEISFVQYVACDQVRDGRRNEGKGTRLNCLVGLTSNRRKRFRGARPHLSLSHVINPDSPISNTLRSVLGLLILMALKRIRESIFFQSNKVTACKVKNRKEVANSFSFHFRVRSI